MNQIEARKTQKAHDVDAKLQRKKEKEEKSKEQAPLPPRLSCTCLRTGKLGKIKLFLYSEPPTDTSQLQVSAKDFERCFGDQEGLH